MRLFFIIRLGFGVLDCLGPSEWAWDINGWARLMGFCFGFSLELY